PSSIRSLQPSSGSEITKPSKASLENRMTTPRCLGGGRSITRSVLEAAAADELAQDAGRRHVVGIDRHERVDELAQAVGDRVGRIALLDLEQVALGVDLEHADLVAERGVEHGVGVAVGRVDV